MLGLAGVVLVLSVLPSACSSWGNFWQVGSAAAGSTVIDNTGTAEWARSVSAAPNTNRFSGVTPDTSGGFFAAGWQDGTGTFTYSGQSISGPTTSSNPTLVHYDQNGNALWARTMSAGSYAQFFAVTTDPSANTFAAGLQTTTGTYTFGGQSSNGTNGTSNVTLVKYDTNGNALWANTVSAGAAQSEFRGVAADASGNVCAVGYQTGTGTYTYSGQSLNGVSASSNAVIIKYNSAGVALWGQTPTAGGISEFYAVAADSSGNFYAVGVQSNTATFTYGGQNATGNYAGSNAVIVKYDAAGNALWARTATTGGNNSRFDAVTVDASGNPIAAGYQDSAGTFTYGGTTVAGPYGAGGNPIIVKFDSSGNGLWARTTTATTNGGRFWGLASDSQGNIFAAGNVITAIAFTFGSQTITGTAGGNNPILVKYSSAGVAQWARTISSGTNSAEFTGVTVNAQGIVAGVGFQNNSESYTYGSGVSAIGAFNSGTNAVIVKYR